MWWLLIATASADEPRPVTQGDVVESKGWLLSPTQYDRCLVNSQNLRTCTEGLDSLVPECVSSVRALNGVLDSCIQQFDEDAARDEQLTTDLLACKEEGAGCEMSLQKVKAQRNTAYLVIGGLVLTGAGVTYLSLAL
jgi:hypothetical protein